MKLHALLAVLVLAAPATTFADRKGSSGGGNRGGQSSYRGSSSNRGYSSYRGSSYGRSHGGSYGRSYGYYSSPRYYSSYPRYYGGYGYGYPYSYYSSPSVVLSYSSTPRSYRDTRGDDYDSLEMDVQQALRRRGYYRGEIDGDIGPGSRSAIRNYQDDRGLAITGRIDGSLLRSLGL